MDFLWVTVNPNWETLVYRNISRWWERWTPGHSRDSCNNKECLAQRQGWGTAQKLSSIGWKTGMDRRKMALFSVVSGDKILREDFITTQMNHLTIGAVYQKSCKINHSRILLHETGDHLPGYWSRGFFVYWEKGCIRQPWKSIFSHGFVWIL